LPEVAERNRDRIARRQVDKFAERRAQLAAAALQTLAEPSSTAYAIFDGLFQHALIKHLRGSADAARDLEENVGRVLESLIVCG
jgi:hypothetical protein